MMSFAGLHAAAFYKEATESGRVWTVRDSGGFPAPKGDAARAMPFWSSRSRVERIIANVPAYLGFDPFEIDLPTFLDRWLPGLQRDGLKAGLNWSGDRAVGYDVEPQAVADGLAHAAKTID
jgi:hypothetical protein